MLSCAVQLKWFHGPLFTTMKHLLHQAVRKGKRQQVAGPQRSIWNAAASFKRCM
jgi:hypothetical protein